MKINRFKLNRAALILFGAAFILLAANIIVSKFQATEQPASNRVLNDIQIDSLFIISLKSFGLSDDWILKQGERKFPLFYKVKIPLDLSVPVILAEIKRMFAGSRIKIVTDERSLNGLSVVEISSKKKSVITAHLNYDDKIVRKKGSIGFVISDFELSESEDSLLLDIPEPFNVLIIPGSENIDVAKYIKSKKKSYSVLLNDDIPELKYKLDESYSGSRLTGSFVSILSDFADASNIFIDQNSGIYNSAALEFLEEEYSKRKVVLHTLSELSTIDFNNDEELVNGFDEVIMQAGAEAKTVIQIDSENFRSLWEEIKRYKKLGYKIVHPGEII